MSKAGRIGERFPVQYFDGINSTVQPTLAKRTELSHAENARSPQIGVLEKREGQVVKGLTTGDAEFVATSNQGLVYFDNDAVASNIFRISTVSSSTDMYFLNASNQWEIMADSDALGLAEANCDFAIADKNLIIVNGTDENRYLKEDGVTVIDATKPGHLFNSPPAKKAVY